MKLSTVERVLFLKGVEIFGQIATEDLILVAAVAHEVSFKAGETFIRQGDIGDCLYILVDGEASITIPAVGQVATRGPKSVLGEMAIISHRPRSADCVATSDVLALRIDHDDFWELLAQKSSVARGVITVLAERLDEAVANIARLTQPPERDVDGAEPHRNAAQ